MMNIFKRKDRYNSEARDAINLQLQEEAEAMFPKEYGPKEYGYRLLQRTIKRTQPTPNIAIHDQQEVSGLPEFKHSGSV